MRLYSEVELPTSWGNFEVRVPSEDGMPKWVAVFKKPWGERPFLRIHSSCLFSEALGSIDCDCSLQLDSALQSVSNEGGAVIYLYQEGRGLGLFRKVTAMKLQADHNLDTATAYQRLGYEVDPRNYLPVIEALESIDFPKTVKVATNNPRKLEALQQGGYDVHRISQKLKLTKRIREYVDSKVNGLDHYESD